MGKFLLTRECNIGFKEYWSVIEDVIVPHLPCECADQILTKEIKTTQRMNGMRKVYEW